MVTIIGQLTEQMSELNFETSSPKIARLAQMSSIGEIVARGTQKADLKLDEHLEKLKKAEEGGDNFEGSRIAANDILNDILETAMELATKTLEDDDPDNAAKPQKNENSGDIRDIIEGLSKINVESLGRNRGESALDIEMKQFLGEIMHQPAFTEGNKRDGVGDQAEMSLAECEEICQMRPSVERKSRATNLVMNAKKGLDHMLTEEQRKKQDEWEEGTEHVIQVIELQKRDLEDSSIPSPSLVYDDLIERPNDKTMDLVNLDATAEEQREKFGAGDEQNVNANDFKGIESKDTFGDKSLEKKKKGWIFALHRLFQCRRNKNKAEKVSSDHGL